MSCKAGISSGLGSAPLLRLEEADSRSMQNGLIHPCVKGGNAQAPLAPASARLARPD